MEKRVIIADSLETDYSVTDCGKVFSGKRGRRTELKHNKTNGGYHIIRLYVSGVKYDRLVHILVAVAFLGKPEEGQQINHKDGNKDNNAVQNLEWCTRSENAKHAYANGLMRKTYKDCYNASLNEEQVCKIRLLIVEGKKQRDIASVFGVSEQVVSFIKHGRNYKGVGLIERGLAIDKNTRI